MRAPHAAQCYQPPHYGELVSYRDYRGCRHNAQLMSNATSVHARHASPINTRYTRYNRRLRSGAHTWTRTIVIFMALCVCVDETFN